MDDVLTGSQRQLVRAAERGRHGGADGEVASRGRHRSLHTRASDDQFRARTARQVEQPVIGTEWQTLRTAQVELCDAHCHGACLSGEVHRCGGLRLTDLDGERVRADRSGVRRSVLIELDVALTAGPPQHHRLRGACRGVLVDGNTRRSPALAAAASAGSAKDARRRGRAAHVVESSPSMATSAEARGSATPVDDAAMLTRERCWRTASRSAPGRPMTITSAE